MQRPHSPSLRRRRLSAELKRARENMGMTTAQVAGELKWAVGKISKIENAETKRISTPDLDRLLDLYKIRDQETREAMQALARDARERGWWSKYKEIFGERALPDFEAEASSIRSFEALSIPGLLQTPEYAEAIFRGGRYTAPEEVKRRVDFRMARREILLRFNPAHLRAVIDEAALRRVIGDREVMRTQLEHLLYMAQLPNVDVQVLPFEAGAHSALAAPFTILDFPDPLDTPIVYIGTVTDAVFLEEHGDIERCSATFGDVQGAAMSTTRSAAFIKDVIASLESDQ
ncbi:helix-turn-helix domain-containing protein [Salinactinospora qingdaonensis]